MAFGITNGAYLQNEKDSICDQSNSFYFMGKSSRLILFNVKYIVLNNKCYKYLFNDILPA